MKNKYKIISNDLLYFWSLSNYLKPANGVMSVKSYIELNCRSLGYKNLQMAFYSMPMGEGNADSTTNRFENESYSYSDPGTVNHAILSAACGFKDL